MLPDEVRLEHLLERLRELEARPVARHQRAIDSGVSGRMISPLSGSTAVDSRDASRRSSASPAGNHSTPETEPSIASASGSVDESSSSSASTEGSATAGGSICWRPRLSVLLPMSRCSGISLRQTVPA